MPPTTPWVNRSRYWPCRQPGLSHLAESGEGRFDQIHGDRGERKEHPEKPSHHGKESQQPKNRMGQYSIEALGEMVDAIDSLISGGHTGRDAFRPCHRYFWRRVRGRQLRGSAPRGQQRRAQCAEPGALCGRHRNHGDTKSARQRGRIDCQTPPLRQVAHVEGHDHAVAAGNDLRRQHEITREVARVDDDHDSILRPRIVPVQSGSGDGAFRRVEVQVVDTRKIENVDRLRKLGPPAAPRSHGGRGTGEIRRLGARPAQHIEQGRLAGVGIAGQHNPADVTRRVLVRRRKNGGRTCYHALPSATAT